MPVPSKISQLPEALRSELDRRLIDRGFSGYEDLSRWLGEHGYSISKSAVGVYGKDLERRLLAVKTSTEAARLISQAAPDDADERSNAIISLVQTEIFQVLLSMQDAEDEPDSAKRIKLLGQAAKNIATLTRASVARNKWAIEIRERAESAARKIEQLASAEGISPETVEKIRAHIMGIV